MTSTERSRLHRERQRERQNQKPVASTSTSVASEPQTQTNSMRQDVAATDPQHSDKRSAWDNKWARSNAPIK
jgi:hypothetical protein